MPILKLLGATLLASLFLGCTRGCTVKDPTYCDEVTPCEPGFWCNLEDKTCYPVDGGVHDGLPPDLAPPDLGPPDLVPGADSGPDGPTPACATQALLGSLGKSHLLVGARMEDSVAKQAPFDLRFDYLSGGISDGAAPCTSCATGCSSGGDSCAGGACNWWGCWQWDQLPPGQFVRDLIDKAIADGQIPMFSFRQISAGCDKQQTTDEVTVAATDVAFMKRYYADWRFALQQIGAKTALLHIEPHFLAYAQLVGPDPTQIAAAVASANPADCASQPNTIAGWARCMIAMARKHAPNARVGLHASAWGTGVNVNYNEDARLDVVAEAKKVGAFLAACGAHDGDYLVVDILDGDAGFYTLKRQQDFWWDATNATLPNFNQHFTWAEALAGEVGLPLLWWQLPVGNMSLPDKSGQWTDNRLDYFFGHTQQVADAHGVGMAFGDGLEDQTTPSTDDGNLVSKVKAYAAAGGQPPVCP
jgi:hypothetical protein